MFFVFMFIVIRGVEILGVMNYIANGIATLHMSLELLIIIIIWVSALLSALIDNIPLVMSMIPVIKQLNTMMGISSPVLFWALSLGGCLGGNGTLVGAGANIVVASIAEKHGYNISFKYFIRQGLPVMILTVFLATVYLLLILLNNAHGGEEIKIMICIIDNIVVYKLADYISWPFPDAEYYLVSLIEHLRRRVLLTRIYKSTLEKTLDKAQKNVEDIMRKKGVKNIHRHIIYDNWRRFLNKFVEKYGIDMIAITSRTTVELGTIGSTTEKVIRLANIPVLLYTPGSEIYPLTDSIKVLVVDGAKIPDNIRDLLAKKYNVEVEEKTLEDLERGRITRFDLVVTSKDTLLRKKIYKKIWAPFIIVP